MAIRWIEGFELNGQSYNLARKVRNSSGAFSLATGYLTGSCLSSSAYVFESPEFADQATWIVNWYWRFDSINFGSQNCRVEIRLDGDDQMHVAPRAYTATNGDDRYYVDIMRDGNTLASAGPFWATDWHSFQLKVTIDPSAGAYELIVDGVSEVSATGVNTAHEGVADADSVYFSMDNGTTNCYLDHIVVADDTGSINDDFLGETLVQAAFPISDGDDTAWTPTSGSAHYSLVNEAGSAVTQETEDPKRVRTATVSADDLWRVTNMASALGLPTSHSVLGVSVETVARMDNSGSRTLQTRYKNAAASATVGDSWLVDDTVYETQVQVWDEEPVGAVPWTLGELAAGQFGVRLQA